MLRIKQQYNELQQTLERREAFLRVLAHDMRNPLAGIVLYAQLLEKRGELSAGQKQYLHMVQAEAQQLRLLLDQMQLLSRLHQGEHKIRPQLTDFRLLLREVTHKYFSATDLETAELTIKLPSTPMPRVLIDRTLLKHLLEILISNAMRFTPRQSTVTLELTTSNVALSSGATPTSAMIENGHYPNLQMIITDQGPPIPETALQILYEHVERWDILAPERAGMGVGLALCKMIAEINAGRLETTNCSPVGVRYTLELPIPETEWNPHHQGMIG